MNDITFSRLYDSQGSFAGLQLSQGGNSIVISLGDSSLDSVKHSYKWDVLKSMIDRHQQDLLAELDRERMESAIYKAIREEE